MRRKLLFVLVCVAFLFAIGCKKEGVALVNAGLRDQPTETKGAFKWVKGVNRGQVVRIMDEQKDGVWMKVQLPDGVTEGWVIKTYIYKGKKHAVEFPESTRLYDQPDADSRVRMNIAAGTKALVLNQKDQWYNVNINWGVDGWVKAGTFKDAAEARSAGAEVYIGGVGKSTVEASSTVPDAAGYSYAVTNLFDKNPGTTWQVEKGGIGQWVEITFPEPVSVSVAMINGFAKVDPKFAEYGADGDLYLLNNRVKSMKVETWDAQDKKLGTSNVNFEDEIRDYQDAGAYQNVSRIRFIIDGVYKGQKWDDTALAEIKVERQ
jgi:hypothetical protein